MKLLLTLVFLGPALFAQTQAVTVPMPSTSGNVMGYDDSLGRIGIQAPTVTEAQKAEWFRQMAVLARIESQQVQLHHAAEAAKAALGKLINEKKAEGCELAETLEGLQCKKAEKPKEAPAK